jgi:hypothetical protein
MRHIVRHAGRGLALVLLLGLPAAAAASEALFLTWGDCAAGAGAVLSITPACISEGGTEVLYVAFSLGQPVDQVLGIETVVDVQSEAAALPDWWHFESAGPGVPAGCHQGGLSASRTFTTEVACIDPWVGTTGDALVQDYQPGAPRGGAGQARIRATAFVSGTDPALTLDTVRPYYGLKLTLDNHGTGACAGCIQPACLVLNSIWLKRPGAPGGDVLLSTPGPLDANWARWEGASGSDCTAVPVRRSTWGQVKSLYR